MLQYQRGPNSARFCFFISIEFDFFLGKLELSSTNILKKEIDFFKLKKLRLPKFKFSLVSTCQTFEY